MSTDSECGKLLHLIRMTKGIIEHKHSSHFNIGQDVSIRGSWMFKANSYPEAVVKTNLRARPTSADSSQASQPASPKAPATSVRPRTQ